MNDAKKVCVLGLGYVGLPTATVLARAGYTVAGVDINETIINTVNSGAIHIVEPGLAEIVSETVSSGNLRAYTAPQPADVFIIAVPTPVTDNYVPDISAVLAAAESITKVVVPGNLVILESTSPVGTTETVAAVVSGSKAGLSEILVAYCPERILPGNILEELVENDRIVGGLSEAATRAASEFYASFVRGKIIPTDARSAEMTKLVENSYRNVNIAFANELSMVCDASGIDTWEVIRLANRHPRVNILQPGPGVGGHCIAIDPLFIAHQSREESKLIQAAHKRNTEKTQWVTEKIKRAAFDFTKKHNRFPVISCFGITYKPDIDDIRESPSLQIVRQLSRDGYYIHVVDPFAKHIPDLKYHDTDDACTHGDILVFLVGHTQFKHMIPPESAIVLDFCGLTKNV